MTIEIVIIVAYLLLLLVVGAVIQRFNGDVSDYFRNGCKGTWWLVGSSAFMAGFSAWTFTGAAGVAFEAGWSVMIIFLANAAGFFINFLFLAPWFRQLRAITAPEVIRDRFGITTQQFYAWISVPVGLLYASLHLYGLAIFSSAVFGLEVNLVILGVGLVVLFYATAGGSWAVMSTDFLQSLVLFPMTILMAYLSLRAIGGVGGFFEQIQAQNLTTDFKLINETGRFDGSMFTIAWAVAMLMQTVVGHNTLNSATRYFAVKDGREARKAALLGSALMFAGAFIWFIPPMVARLLFAADVSAIDISKPAESAYAIASMKLLPVGMTGLMVVAMFSATMSSMDTGLNRNAAIFTQDIYPACCKVLGLGELKGKALMWLGQAFSLGMGLLIIMLAWYFASADGAGIFEFMINISAMLALPLATPMLLAMFIRKAPWWSAIFSAGVALACSVASMWAQEPWAFHEKVFWNLGTGTLAFFATMPFWRFASEQYRERVNAFFTRMHTPVDFEREVGSGNDLSQLKIIGLFAIVTGGMINLLMLFPDTWHDRLAVLFVGGTVMSVGGLLWLVGMRSQPQAVSEIETPAEETSANARETAALPTE